MNPEPRPFPAVRAALCVCSAGQGGLSLVWMSALEAGLGGLVSTPAIPWGGGGFPAGSLLSLAPEHSWEAEVPLYAPFFLLKLFPFSLWLALVLSKPITYLCIMFFSSFLFSSFQALSLVTV